jgi:hypothetical protein
MFNHPNYGSNELVQIIFSKSFNHLGVLLPQQQPGYLLQFFWRIKKVPIDRDPRLSLTLENKTY